MGVRQCSRVTDRLSHPELKRRKPILAAIDAAEHDDITHGRLCLQLNRKPRPWLIHCVQKEATCRVSLPPLSSAVRFERGAEWGPMREPPHN